MYVVSFISAYIVGTPDAPDFTSGPGEAFAYFGGEYSAFLFFNRVLPIFSAFFLSWFVGILHGVLRRAEGEGGGLSSAALVGA